MMRKPTRTEDRKSPSIVSRRQRLAFIATLVVSSGIHGSQGTVVLAENPSIVSHGTLPPLPVEVSNRPAGIQNNPFFQPVAPAADAAVRLASGSSQSAIRLRPIGAPIDLNTIGEDPVRVRPSSISIDEIPPANVQSNPLIGSAHHENAGLVDTLTLEMPATQSLDGATKSMPVASSIPEFRPPAARSAPIVAAQPASQFVARGTSELAPVLSSAPENMMPQVQLATDARDAQEPIAESQPIYFSISDKFKREMPALGTPIVMAEEPKMDDAPEADIPVAAATTTSGTPIQVADVKIDTVEQVTAPLPPVMPEHVTVVENSFAEIAEPVMADGPSEPFVIEEESIEAENFVAESIEAESFEAESFEAESFEAESITADRLALEDKANLNQVPLVEQNLKPAPEAVYRDEPVVAAPVMTPEPLLVQRRYRPPVAVDSPPIAIARDISSEAESISVPTVQSIETPMFVLEELSEQAKIEALPEVAASKSSALYMTRTQVRSLTIGGHVRRVAVGDKNVCQAFAAGPNQLKLIGTGSGVTRLVVWADSTDSSPTRVRSFEIHVEDKAAPVGISDKTVVLNQSIRQAFPNSRINVQQQKNSLVASGDCQSEEMAKDIIRMIRKTCLIPVRDEIQVR